MPTALARPWPSGPVVVSMPMSRSRSGWPGGARTELAEVLELLDRQRVAGQMQQRVQQHRAVAVREHEAVAVRPTAGCRGCACRKSRHSTSAMSAMPIGMPGWPELARCTASMPSARMALASSRRLGIRDAPAGNRHCRRWRIIFRMSGDFLIHLRVRLRRPSGQGRRPDLGRGARRHPRAGPAARASPAKRWSRRASPIVAGEITTSAWVDLEALVRARHLRHRLHLLRRRLRRRDLRRRQHHRQAVADIAQGVDRADPENQGAGDQGLMFGYATQRDRRLMPAPIHYAHRLVERQAKVRKGRNPKLPWLRPDAKSQVTFALRGRQAGRHRGRRALDAARAGRQAEGPARGRDGGDHQAGAARRAGSTSAPSTTSTRPAAS